MSRRERMAAHKIRMAARRIEQRNRQPGFTGMGWGRRFKDEYNAYLARQIGRAN